MSKLFIFDLDGTLLNTLPTIAYYGNLALAKLGFSPIEQDRYRLLVGDGRDLLIHRMLSEKNADTPENFVKAASAYDAAYEADVLYLTEPYPGVVEQLCLLKEKGAILSVLSNKPDNVAQEVVKKKFDGIFDIAWGKRDNFPIKPNPEAALSIQAKFKAQAEDTYFIGDTSVDILTGKNAGFHTVGVSWGFRGREELFKAGAERIISSTEELANAIFKIESEKTSENRR